MSKADLPDPDLEKQATGDRQPATGNEEPTHHAVREPPAVEGATLARSSRHVSEREKQATGDRQPATGNEEPTRHAVREPPALEGATVTVAGATFGRNAPRPREPLRKGADIAQRMRVLAAEVIHVARTLPRDFATRHIAQQVIRSGTSAGANYEEARAAESRGDFIHKLGVSAKELRETLYWLDLIDHAGLTRARLDLIRRETVELSAILGASIKTARDRPAR